MGPFVAKDPELKNLQFMKNNGGEEIAKTNISSMAQSIMVLKKDVYKNKPVEFAGGITLNVSLRHSNRSK